MEFTLPNPPILTQDGDFDFETLPGRAYTFLLKGEFDGAIVTLSVQSTARAEMEAVVNGTWTGEAEVDFRATGRKSRLSVSNAGAATAIRVTLVGHN